MKNEKFESDYNASCCSYTLGNSEYVGVLSLEYAGSFTLIIWNDISVW